MLSPYRKNWPPPEDAVEQAQRQWVLLERHVEGQRVGRRTASGLKPWEWFVFASVALVIGWGIGEFFQALVKFLAGFLVVVVLLVGLSCAPTRVAAPDTSIDMCLTELDGGFACETCPIPGGWDPKWTRCSVTAGDRTSSVFLRSTPEGIKEWGEQIERERMARPVVGSF